MSAPEKDVINAIYNAISADATISAYVKTFIKGRPAAEKSFPFISVFIESADIKRLTIGATGKNEYTFSAVIVAGVKSLNDEAALMDSGSEKGIYTLVNDIITLVETKANTFGGVLSQPCEVGGISYYPLDSHFVYVATIPLACKKIVFRTGCA